MRPILPILLLLAVSAGLVTARDARAEDEPQVKRTLVVGTKEAPPFSMKTGAGTGPASASSCGSASRGRLGSALGVPGDDPRRAARRRRATAALDAAVAALTVTAEREETIDFTHPFHTSGLGIAVPAHGRSGLGAPSSAASSLGLPEGRLRARARPAAERLRSSGSSSAEANPEQFGGKRCAGSRQRLLVVRGHDDDGRLRRQGAGDRGRAARRARSGCSRASS